MVKSNKVYSLRIILSTVFAIIILSTSLVLGLITFFGLKEFIRSSFKNRLHDIACVSPFKIDPKKHKILMTRED